MKKLFISSAFILAGILSQEAESVRKPFCLSAEEAAQAWKQGRFGYCEEHCRKRGLHSSGQVGEGVTKVCPSGLQCTCG